MDNFFQSISGYMESPNGQWLLACFLIAVLNQVFLVRYLIWIVRNGRLGFWQLRGMIAVFLIAVDMLAFELGHGNDLMFALVVVFCVDLFFFGSGILKGEERGRN